MDATVKYAIVGAGNITSATINGIDAVILVGEKQIEQQTDMSVFTEPYIIRNIDRNVCMINLPKLSHRRNYKYHK